MKKCKSCEQVLPLSDYYTNGSYNGNPKYKPTCKGCEYAADCERYYKIISEYFNGLSCSQCGYSRCAHALELHHINPAEKEYGVSKMKNYSEAKIVKELSKCVLLCANCHREVHAGGIEL